MLIKEFQPIDNNIQVLSNPNIWAVEDRELLGEYLSKLVKDLLEIIPGFIKNGYVDNNPMQSGIKPKLLRDVCYWLSEDRCLTDALFESNGWKELLGLELAKYQLRKYYKRHEELPLSKQFISLSGAIRKGRWRKYSITTWNELLNQIFGETKNKEWGHYVGSTGFENAVREAKEFAQKEGRLPKSNDLITIKTKITEGYWREMGVFKWNDFLKHVFDDVNVDRSINYSLYEGKEGLKLAQNETKQFKIKYNKNPRISDLQHISRVIDNGNWIAFGILNWNEFLSKTTGVINMRHNKYVAYKGKKGLEKAQEEAKLFEMNKGRLPKRRDLKAINQAIMNGYWKRFGIFRFNDFLQFTFGKINMKANGYYKGKRGLNRALKEGLNFYDANGKLPSKRNLRTIYSLIYDRGYWKDLGINNWEDYKLEVLRIS
ncbi:MAG: hypothetical protein INQ03_22965 [Candidatus Heimdallarchaeota archaeon]|nr:hypothetical protein [Candidatus Heimdallarchaeota archaeon]